MHITDLESVREYLHEFKDHRVQMKTCISDAICAISEICVWMEMCEEEAYEKKQQAIKEVKRFRYELKECESQADEDYWPDCSYEEEALENALVKLEIWRFRYSRVNDFKKQVHNAKSKLQINLDSFRNTFNKCSLKGSNYLSDQMNKMEEILRLKVPKV